MANAGCGYKPGEPPGEDFQQYGCAGRAYFRGFQMLAEEFLHRFVELELVLLQTETVAFVVLDHVFDGNAALLERLDHLVALGFHHARVFAPWAMNSGVLMRSLRR